MRYLCRRALLSALTCVLFASCLGPVSSVAQSDATIGAPAPEFTLKDTDGDTHKLSDYEGTYVVLEWMDFRCPFTRKHYDTGNMQSLQETYTDKNVVWLSVYSASPNHPAHYPPQKMAATNAKLGGHQTAMLMDPTGAVGKSYGARRTPEMYVINPEGMLIYKGGIDDRPTRDTSDVEGATNYVRTTLEAAMNGEPVRPKKAQPYGCPIKYAR